MSTSEQVREVSHRDHLVLYVILAGALLALIVAGLFTYNYNQQTQAAKNKAAQLERRWHALGLQTPANRDVLIRQYGTDGGAVCDTSSDALTQALLKTALTNGAGGPGQRAVIVDKDVVAGERAVVEVYCPDRLASFDHFTSGLKFRNVIRDA
jgi:hypothetical protein